MESKYFDKANERISKESKSFTSLSFDIIDRIHMLLEAKQITQRELAEKLGKKESEISRWLSPGHNFTLKTIAKLEAALDASILEISTSSNVIKPKKVVFSGK